jgi:hypothetical protein
MPQTKPSIVFAHGIWADGLCFRKVIPALQAEGHAEVPGPLHQATGVPASTAP